MKIIDSLWLLIVTLLLTIFLALMIVGCGQRYMMTRPEIQAMNNADMLITTAARQDNFSVITLQQNHELLAAEGIDGKVSWLAVIWDRAGKSHQYLAINPSLKDDRLRMDIVCFLPVSELLYVAVFSHLGKVAYNAQGQGVAIKSWNDFNPAEHNDFFRINQVRQQVRQIEKNSPEYMNYLQEVRQAFEQEGGRKLLEQFKEKYKTVLKKYRYKIPPMRLKQITAEDQTAQALSQLLNKGWFVYGTVPFVGINNTAIIKGIKEVSRPDVLFADKMDMSNYQAFNPEATRGADLVKKMDEIKNDNSLKTYNEPIVINSEQAATPKTALTVNAVVLVTGSNKAQTIYRIKKGDTLSKIAARYNVKLAELYEANKDKIYNQNKIYPRQKLVVPESGYALVKSLGQHRFGKKRSPFKAIKMFSLPEEVKQFFIAKVKKGEFQWGTLKKGDKREQMAFGKYRIQNKIQFDFPEGHLEAARRYSAECQGNIFRLEIPLKRDNLTWWSEKLPPPK